MTILLLGAQKGGSGKSTTAVNLCAQLANAGHDVVLLDADRQSTAANWANDRAENPELAKVNCVQKYDNIRPTLLDLNERYAYVVVDTAGRDSRELRTGMTTPDSILIIPFKPSLPDLDTLPFMQKLIIETLDNMNPTLKVYGLLTMAPTNPVIHETEDAKELLKKFIEIELLKTIVRDRKVYRDAMVEGKGIIEMNNPKAKIEIANLMKEILSGTL